MGAEIITVQNINDRLEQISLMLSGFHGPIECDVLDPDYEKCLEKHNVAYQKLMAEEAELIEQLKKVENKLGRS